MKKTVLVTFLTAISVIVFAQPWMQNIPEKKRIDHSYNFYDIQKAFNTYWEGKPQSKGSGWKQFKRQEWFLEPRIYPSGVLNTQQLWLENQKITQQKLENRNIANWTYIGPDNTAVGIVSGQRRGSGRVNCVAFHPTDNNILFAGAPAGGFWKSTDAGQSWQTTTDMLGSLGVSSIAVDTQNPNIIYIATGDRDGGDTYSVGLLKSTDGGLTWVNTNIVHQTTSNIKGNEVLLDPTNPQIGYYASSAGLYKTTDGFQTATQLLSGNIKDIVFHPTNPSIIYASGDWGSGIALLKSVDSGSNFTDISSSFSGSARIAIAVTANAPDAVFALCGNNSGGLYGVYKSADKGASWSQLIGTSPNLMGWSSDGSDSGGQAWYDLAFAVSPTNQNIIFVGGVNIWNTTDGGSTWNIKAHWTGTQTAQYVHADQHIFAYSPGGELFAGNDGGLYKTANDGNLWSDLSDGLHILQPYKLSTSPTDPDRLLIGNQDNGTFLRNNGTWNAVMGGDGMECIIDYTDENILYGSVYYGSISKSTDGGRTFSNIGVPGSGAWVTPYILHPQNHNILYVAKDDVYKTTNGGQTWSNLTNGLSQGSRYRSIAISPVNPDYLYLSTSYTMWKSTDAGITWVNITPSVSSAITYIACSDIDAKKVWISLSGFTASQKVMESVNEGTSWTNISNGLPNIPVNCIAHQNQSNDLLYVGTDLGVYVKNDGMASWQLYSAGLPNVVVDELEINYSNKKITAATFGRGVWQASLFQDISSPPLADFTSNTTQACTDGTPIIFTDNSYGEITTYSWDFGANAIPATATGIGPHSVTYSVAGQKTVQLTTTAAAGSNTKTMIISAASQLSPTVSPVSTAICRNGTVELTATGGDTYTWSPSSSLNSASGATVVASPASTQTYTVVAQIGTCTGSTTVNVQVNQQTNDDIQNPIQLVQGDNGYFSNECATTQLNEPTPPLNNCNSQMAWCGEGGVQGSVWFTVTAPLSGKLTVETHGFDNQIALYDANTFADLFSGNYTLLAANDDYFPDYSAAITGVSGLTPGKKYWLQIDGSAGGAQGSCQVIIGGNNVAVDRISEEYKFEISPNPVQNEFKISWNSEIKANKLEIYNINGEILFSKRTENETEVQLNFSKLAKGLYFVKLYGEKQTFSQKIMKQ